MWYRQVPDFTVAHTLRIVASMLDAAKQREKVCESPARGFTLLYD